MQRKLSMDTVLSQSSYVSLKLSEIQERFEQLMAEEKETELSLVDSDPLAQTIADTCDPYNRG